MSVIPLIALWAAILAVVAIGANLLLHKAQRREDGRGERASLPAGGDPANLRRIRPTTNRLSGAVLIAAAIVLVIVLRPALGIG